MKVKIEENEEPKPLPKERIICRCVGCNCKRVASNAVRQGGQPDDPVQPTGDVEMPPPPPPGPNWTNYSDGGKIWWYHVGPLGEWWCPDTDKQDICRYHNNEATLADTVQGPPPDTHKKDVSRTSVPISHKKVEERNDDVGTTELGIASLSLSSSSSGPAGGMAVQPASAGPYLWTCISGRYGDADT